MKADLKIGVRAEYKLIRMKAVTNENGERVPGEVVEETPWTKNILTLNYFNQALTTGRLLVRGIVVGAGTSAPSEGQGNLDSFIAATESLQSYTPTLNTITSPRYTRKEWRYRFGEGVAEGNVSEVGMITTAFVGTINSASPISSRARVTDNLGNPTTITILEDEFLDVIWRCTWYVPEDVTGSCFISIDGVPTEFNWTIRATLMNSSGSNTHWITPTIGFCPTTVLLASSGNYNPTVTTDTSLWDYDSNYSWPTDSNSLTENPTAQAYTPNSKNRNFNLKWGLTRGNIEIRSIFFMNKINYSSDSCISLGAWQILLDKPITKIDTKQLTLVINMALDNV